jgi:RimJ/RimL family protein N-acetyltransferase
MAGLVSLNPPFAVGVPELGWILWDGYEGHGLASEAAAAVLRFAWGELGWMTLVSGIHEANTKSARLAERLGARLEPDIVFSQEPETRFYRFRAASQPGGAS